MFERKDIESLLSESRRLLRESESKDLYFITPDDDLAPEIEEIFKNLSEAIQKQQHRMQYENMKYKLANQALQTGLWDMDVVDNDPINPDNVFIWSDEFRKMLGFANENDFPNKLISWSDRLHPDDKQRTLDAFTRHMMDYSGKTPYNLEYRLKLKNGEYHYFHALGDTMRDGIGRPIRVAGVLRNIHDEKMHNDIVSQANETNALQMTKLNLVIKAAKIGLWDMEVMEDPVNPANIFTWSDEFRYMLGYSNQNDFPNLLGSWSDLLHPDDKDRTLDSLLYHLLDQTGKTPYNVEYRLLKKNGEYGYFHAYGETIRDINGFAIRVAGALKDVTEEKEAAIEMARVIKQRAEAEAANKAKSSFLAKMSHEIRTPLNAIIGIAEIQLHDETIAPNIKEALVRIYNSGDLLLGIINDILDLSKIEAGKLELLPIKYDVASLINDTITLNMMRIGSKQIRFELHVDENTPVLLIGDELRIREIINNILSNAIKYTDEGFIKFTISAEINSGNEFDVTLVFNVSDTGQGMSEEQVSNLFNEYSRFNLEANRTTQGTGLGMNIVNNLVHMMNGEISVKSRINFGTTFTVRLPQKSVGAGPIGREIAENLQKFSINDAKQFKRSQIVFDPMPYGSILIVDDVESNLYVAKGLMLPYGLKIETVLSGFEAINKIKAGNIYNIIFMDHMMPKMDGIETTQKIRAMGYSHPIVALTANAIVGQSDIFLTNGFDDFISKPIDARHLNIILKNFVRDKQSTGIREVACHENGGQNEHNVDEKTTLLAMNPCFKEIFIRDASKIVATLEDIYEKNDFNENEDIKVYTISVHGIKSALANIGELELSAFAFKLEQAGRDKDNAVILSETPIFLSKLKELIKKLTPSEIENAGNATTGVDKVSMLEKLHALKELCIIYDKKAAKSTLIELRKKTWSNQVNEMLSAISEHLLGGGFEEAIDTVENIIKLIR